MPMPTIFGMRLSMFIDPSKPEEFLSMPKQKTKSIMLYRNSSDLCMECEE